MVKMRLLFRYEPRVVLLDNLVFFTKTGANRVALPPVPQDEDVFTDVVPLWSFEVFDPIVAR